MKIRQISFSILFPSSGAPKWVVDGQIYLRELSKQMNSKLNELKVRLVIIKDLLHSPFWYLWYFMFKINICHKSNKLCETNANAN